MTAPPRAVTFDFGQTLAEMDTAMLSRRLRERGVEVAEHRLEAATTAAWQAYNRAVLAGLGGHPWKLLVDTLLEGAGVTQHRAPLVDWLWDEQPRANLWRKPIPGMIELARELRAAGVPVGVVSNSEGRLAELAAEMGWGDEFVCIADSGRLGVEKPGREIFAWTAERLGVALEDVVHVGDAWAADYVAALGHGMRAVLFRGEAFVPPGDARAEHPRGARCVDAAGLRAVLARWTLLPAA